MLDSTAFYIISTPDKAAHNKYKIGSHTGSINKLIKRYATYYPDVVLHYFQYLENAYKIEGLLKNKLYDYRITNVRGRKSELVIMPLEILKNEIDNILENYDNIIVDTLNGIDFKIPFNGRKSKIYINAEYNKISPNIYKKIKDTDFEKSICSILLYYKKKTYDDINFYYVNNLKLIKNQKRLHKLIPIIEWMENKLGVGRFEITNLQMEYNDLEPLKKKMIKKIEMFQWLSTQSITIRKNDIESRINKISSIDRLIKFFMDIINQFDNFYDYGYKRVTRAGVICIY